MGVRVRPAKATLASHNSIYSISCEDIFTEQGEPNLLLALSLLSDSPADGFLLSSVLFSPRYCQHDLTSQRKMAALRLCNRSSGLCRAESSRRAAAQPLPCRAALPVPRLLWQSRSIGSGSARRQGSELRRDLIVTQAGSGGLDEALDSLKETAALDELIDSLVAAKGEQEVGTAAGQTEGKL